MPKTKLQLMRHPIAIRPLYKIVRIGWISYFIIVALLSKMPHASASSIAHKEGGTFRYSLPISPPTLNPITSHDNYSVDVMWWMVESLLAHDQETYEWRPRLAETFEISPDRRTFIFQLRHGVKFHDGSEMTADDVKFSFDVYATDLYDTVAENAQNEDIAKVEILDRYRVKISMKNAKYAGFQRVALMPILSKSTYGDKTKTKLMNKSVIGTGPYRFESFTTGNSIVLKANKEWWGRNIAAYSGSYKFDQITVKIVNDSQMALMMFEKGDLDYLKLTPDLYSSLKKALAPPWGQTLLLEEDRSLEVATTQTSVFWNLRSPIFRSRDTRLALQMLFNRELINEKMLGNESLLATGPWHRLSDYADPQVKPVPFDAAGAAKLLAKDGWSDRDGDGLLDKIIDGKKVDFKFSVMIARESFAKYLIAYQTDLKKYGIQLDIRFTDWSLMLKQLDNLNFDAYVIGRGWPNNIDFDPNEEWNSKYRGKRQGNVIGYANQDVDRILEKNQLEPLRDVRIRNLRLAYRLISLDQPQLFWFSEPLQHYAVSSRIRKSKPYIKYGLGWEDWSLQ